MKNKYLITVVVPKLEVNYDVYIPSNKKIGTIKQYLLLAINKLSDNSIDINPNNKLFIDQETGKELVNDVYVRDSGIINGSKIIIL